MAGEGIAPMESPMLHANTKRENRVLIARDGLGHRLGHLLLVSTNWG